MSVDAPNSVQYIVLYFGPSDKSNHERSQVNKTTSKRDRYIVYSIAVPSTGGDKVW